MRRPERPFIERKITIVFAVARLDQADRVRDQRLGAGAAAENIDRIIEPHAEGGRDVRRGRGIAGLVAGHAIDVARLADPHRPAPW